MSTRSRSLLCPNDDRTIPQTKQTEVSQGNCYKFLFISQPALWNDSVFAELGEEVFEHVLRIYAIVETSAARLDGARNVVKLHETQNGVSERPGGNLLVTQRLQAVFADHSFPDSYRRYRDAWVWDIVAQIG